MQIDGKRIVLTGAASGIGRALLVEFAQYDVEVVAADVDAERLGESVRTPTNVRASLNPFVCDLVSKGGTDELIAHALATMSGIDIFVANAGIAYYERLREPGWEHMTAIYNVNVFSPLYTAVRMSELNPDNPYTVVMTASTMAHWGLPGYSLYASTKSALDRFGDTYRYEMPAHGHLMLVYPIGTRTAFFERAGAPLAFPLQDPETVARAIVHGIEHDQRTVYPSFLWKLLYTLNRVFPIMKPLTQRYYLRALEQWELENG